MVRLSVWTRHYGLGRMMRMICGQILNIWFLLVATCCPVQTILRIACVYEALIYFGGKRLRLHRLLLLDLSPQTVTILIAFRVDCPLS